MKVQVEEQTKKFHLADEKGWVGVVGHGVHVGEYYFCIIPMAPICVNVSEATAGLKVLEIPFTKDVLMATITKEDTMRYFEKIGQVIAEQIEKQGNFDEMLAAAKEQTFAELGERPEIIDFDF